MKAKNEGEALAHMRKQFAGNGLSGWATEWQQTKTAQLARLSSWWEVNHPPRRPMRVLELGVGDLTHLRGWGAFTSGVIDYTGVDFVPDVIVNARREFPQHRWVELPFSGVRDYFNGAPLPMWDLILLLDVLYHIPSDLVYQDVLDFAFERAVIWVMLTHATDMTQVFDCGRQPGDAGFCWFPRPFEMPIDPGIDEFVIDFETDADTVQKQRLIVAERI